MTSAAVDWMIEALMASALLIGLVLLMRRPVARHFGPHIAYLLWALPVLRLILPPLPEHSVGAEPLIIPQISPALPVSDTLPFQALPTSIQTVHAEAPIDLGLALFVVWAAGACLHMAWHVVSYRRFVAKAVGSQSSTHLVGKIRLYNADIAGPAAAGIVHRRILLPYDFFDRFGPRERRLALAHELAHHSRGDLVMNWVGLAVLSLHWFNPLAHIAYRAFRADQEQACDATVLANASPDERHTYATAVVKAAWSKAPVAACPLNNTKQLKMRLVMMSAGALSVQRRLVGAGLILIVSAGALGLTASRSDAKIPERGLRAATSKTVAAAVRSAPQILQELTGADDPIGNVAYDTEADPISNLVKPAAEPKAATSEIESPAPSGAVVVAQSGPAPIEGFVPHGEIVRAADVTDLLPVSLPEVSQQADPLRLVVPMSLVEKHLTEARRVLQLTPRATSFRNVHLVIVSGELNANNPGKPFIGFCGQMRVNSRLYSKAWAAHEWRPFFVSASGSSIPGKLAHFNYADNAVAAKCSGPQASEDFAAKFAYAGRVTVKRNGDCNRSTCGPSYTLARMEPLSSNYSY